MRRYLVLGDETARHPFRQSLPPHVRDAALAAPLPRTWREVLEISREDVRGFATSYVACLVAVAAFIF
ncbi:hypothetical protein GRI89_07485 [Altererythrobacter salegens]|uniref:Uncharacterized protein n=1 Tax=Croceibacterium salegens TaxID=1737568 RepID=A0A6I4STS9_9SPHN|nr:hypothetical protein [Croceibacterium salegens]MXO59381.1 hypothetical protein [Croceibacterium salegens]